VDYGQTIVSIVGNQIASSEDILQKFFSSIHHIPVRMISFGGSPHNITILIPETYKKEILQLINKGVFGL
jgi:aspartate kinase